MRAFRIDPDSRSPDGCHALQQVDLPEPAAPGEREIEIRVHAAGVNRPDLLHRQDRYLFRPRERPFLGLEVAGIVARLGPGASRFGVGDRVCALVDGGGYAERVVCHEDHALPVPGGLTLVEAAALPEAFATVWLALVRRAAIAPGETALIHAAASGVAIAGVQLLGWLGHRVFVTARRREQVERSIRECHADGGSDWPFVDEVKAWARPKGRVDVILDCVGQRYFNANLECLAPRGRLILIGFLSGRTGQLDLGRVLPKQLRIEGCAVRLSSPSERAELMDGLRREVWPMFEEGGWRPVVDRVFPFERAEHAHQRLLAPDHFGKVVLQLP